MKPNLIKFNQNKNQMQRRKGPNLNLKMIIRNLFRMIVITIPNQVMTQSMIVKALMRATIPNNLMKAMNQGLHNIEQIADE